MKMFLRFAEHRAREREPRGSEVVLVQGSRGRGFAACPSFSLLLLLGLFVAILLTGCARLGGTPGDPLLCSGDYAAAVAAYEAMEAERPDDPAIKRNLGAALFHVRQLDRARRKLGEAASLDPKDPHLFYYIGRVEDEGSRPDAAMRAYSRYLSLGGRHTPFLRGRMELLGKQIAKARLRAAEVAEASLAESLSTRPPPANSLVVTEFANLSDSDTLRALCRGLAAIMIYDLLKVDAFRILERERVQVIIDELAMSGRAGEAGRGPGSEAVPERRPGEKRPDQPADESLQEAGEAERERDTAVVGRHAPKLGWVLQARHLVQGSILRTGEDRIQLGGQVLDVMSSELEETGSPIPGDLDKVLQAEKRLVYQVLTHFGIEPSPEEREEIDQLPTERFLAFLSYSRGLLLEDGGSPEAARNEYAAALAEDPGFANAKERLDLLEAIAEGGAGPDRAFLDDMIREPPERSNLAIELLGRVGGVPLPGGSDGIGVMDGEGGSGDGGDSDDSRITDAQSTVVGRRLPDFPDPPWRSRGR